MRTVLGRQGRVMPAEEPERLSGPGPSLQHLAWSFAKIVGAGSAVELGVCRLGDEIMYTVTELMEEHTDFDMLEEAWPAGLRFLEVADQHGSWVMTCPICLDEALAKYQKSIHTMQGVRDIPAAN